jgi:hypothetical protein
MFFAAVFEGQGNEKSIAIVEPLQQWISDRANSQGNF